MLDRRPDGGQVERLERRRGRSRSRTAGCRSRRAGSARSRPSAARAPAPSSRPVGEVLGARARARPMSTRQVRRAGDRRADLPGERLDRERVALRPAAAAQVQDGLARAVARQLGLRAVGVEDPQAGDEPRRVRRARAAGCRRSRRPGAGRRCAGSASAVSSKGSAAASTIEVVVAERLPLLELHVPSGVVATVRRGDGSSTRRWRSLDGGRRQDLRGHVAGIAAGDVDRPKPGELAHPGELALGVAARAHASSPRTSPASSSAKPRAWRAVAEAPAASAARTSSTAPAATIASTRASIRA